MTNEIEKIVDLMQRDDSVPAPKDSIRWVKNLFIERAAQQRPSLVRRLVAMLEAELAPGRAALGERSAAASAERQLLFTVENHGIDVRISESGKKFSVSGHLLSEEIISGNAKLTGSGYNRETAVKEGTFEFADIPPGRYSLILLNDEIEISTEEFSI